MQKSIHEDHGGFKKETHPCHHEEVLSIHMRSICLNQFAGLVFWVFWVVQSCFQGVDLEYF